MFFYDFMSALLHSFCDKVFICLGQIKAKGKHQKDSMRLCIMLILNSCPEQHVCVHVRASASASASLATWASSSCPRETSTAGPPRR